MGDNEKSLDMETLDQSFNDSIENLMKVMNPDKSLEKAKKKEEDEDDEEGIESETPEDDEEKAEKKEKPVMKSIEESMAEEPDAEAAIEIEPFLRTLVKGIDDKFSEVFEGIDALKKSISYIEKLTKSQADTIVKSAQYQKSINETVEKIGNTPQKSSTVLRKAGDKYENSESSEDLDLSREEVLDRVLSLKKSGKLSNLDVTKIEGRLNAKMPLTKEYNALIKSAK